MAKYKVWVRLENEYNDIEADSAEEAFEIASESAMQGGCWEWYTKLVEEEDEDE